jgi:hypothetical protein
LDQRIPQRTFDLGIARPGVHPLRPDGSIQVQTIGRFPALLPQKGATSLIEQDDTWRYTNDERLAFQVNGRGIRIEEVDTRIVVVIEEAGIRCTPEEEAEAVAGTRGIGVDLKEGQGVGEDKQSIVAEGVLRKVHRLPMEVEKYMFWVG